MKFHWINFEKNAVDMLESLSSNPKNFWSFLNEINPLSGDKSLIGSYQSDPSQVYDDVTHVNNIKNSVHALLLIAP